MRETTMRVVVGHRPGGPDVLRGEREQILGELIAGERDRWIVTTTCSGASIG